MTSEDGQNKQQHIEKLLTLMNVKTSPIESTRYFQKAQVSHNDLCDAFAYWIDQVKMAFGEPVSITQNQSLRDAGVDVLIDLQRSRIKFGIQVKSPGDVNNKGLSREVHAQITQSHRHNLSKLILAFAADYTNKEYLQRVGGLISEIHQGDYGYVIIVPPERVLTIYRAYKSKEHPMKHVFLQYDTAMKLINAIAESMSDEKRTVTTKIDFKYKLDDKELADSKYVSTIEFNADKDGVRVLDDMENAHVTGEIVKINNVKQIKVHDKAGNKLFSEVPHDGKIFVWSERSDAFPMAIQVTDMNGKTLHSIEPRMFHVSKTGEEVHVANKDDNAPLSVEFVLSPVNNTIQFNFGIDYGKGDAIQLFSAIQFLESLKNENKLKIFDFKFNDSFVLDIPESFAEVSPVRYNIARALSVIQKYTGQRFFMPDQITKSELLEMMNLASLIEKGQDTISSVPLTMDRLEAFRLLEAYRKNEITDKSVVPIIVQRTILGREVTIQVLIKLLHFKPRGEISELIGSAQNSAEQAINIELDKV